MIRFVVVLCVLLVGCGQPTHHGVGTVVDVRADLHQIMLDHDDIVGVMPAMTMNFDVPDASLLSGVRAGDRIEFELLTDDGHFQIVSITPVEGEQQPVADDRPRASLAAVIPEEDSAPAFELTDQDGNTRSLDALRGSIVLLDFIYTHCNGPCPVLTSARVQLQKKLPESIRERLHFVSISLDAQRDTPADLRRYALDRGADLANWSFLTGEPAVVEEVLKRYGVGVVRGSDGSDIQHVVVTFLIDPQGRITKRYFGLDHDTGEYLRDLVSTARG